MCTGTLQERYSSQSGFLDPRNTWSWDNFKAHLMGLMLYETHFGEMCLWLLWISVRLGEMLPPHPVPPHPQGHILPALLSHLFWGPKREWMGPWDSILFQSSSIEKKAKVTIIAYPLGETKVNHRQVNFLKVKTFLFFTFILFFIFIFFTYGNRAFVDKWTITISLYFSLLDHWYFL